jgi:ubiquinone/menaquinone biosynthesis C-methylase UbiE
MKSNYDYWNKFYKLQKANNKPSKFAQFIKKKFLNKKNHLLEIGCGDGRDSFYFKNYVKKILAIDQSKSIIKKNIEITKKRQINNVDFQIVNVDSKKILSIKGYNFIYARFFLHAINFEQEKKFLNFLNNYSDKDTIVALEFRTTKDTLLNKGKRVSKYERLTDHYRRFINVDDFIKKITNSKFKIIYKKQGINLSKYKDDNPYLCRLIFKL